MSFRPIVVSYNSNNIAKLLCEGGIPMLPIAHNRLIEHTLHSMNEPYLLETGENKTLCDFVHSLGFSVYSTLGNIKELLFSIKEEYILLTRASTLFIAEENIYEENEGKEVALLRKDGENEAVWIKSKLLKKVISKIMFKEDILNEIVKALDTMDKTVNAVKVCQSITSAQTYYEMAMKYRDIPYKGIKNNSEKNASHIGTNAIVKNSFIGSNCSLKGEIENSVIFSSVVIEENSRIENSVILNGVKIGEDSFVKNSVIGEQNTNNLTIGKHSAIGYIDPRQKECPLTVIAKNVHIPSPLVIEAGAFWDGNTITEEN